MLPEILKLRVEFTMKDSLPHTGPRIARLRKLSLSGAQRAPSTYRTCDIPDEQRLAMLEAIRALMEAPSVLEKFKSRLRFSSCNEDTSDNSAMTLAHSAREASRRA